MTNKLRRNTTTEYSLAHSSCPQTHQPAQVIHPYRIIFPPGCLTVEYKFCYLLSAHLFYSFLLLNKLVVNVNTYLKKTIVNSLM